MVRRKLAESCFTKLRVRLCMTLLCSSLPARSTYTQAFVRQLPLHRALPVLFWVALSRLLRWQPPVLPLRRAILREARREGLPTMYRVILGAFGPEIGCALGVSHPGCARAVGIPALAQESCMSSIRIWPLMPR